MKITRRRLKEIIKEELGDLQTEPRYEGGTPEERLLNKLLIRSKVADAPDALAAAEMLGLGEDEEVVAYLDSLMGNPMYDSPNMEEAIQSGGKPPKPAEQHSEVGYNPTKLTRKTFHKKARKDAKQVIKKGEIEEATPEGYPMTNKQKRAEIGMAEEEPLHLSRPKHDPLDRSPAGLRARRRLQGKGIKNYPLDK